MLSVPAKKVGERSSPTFAGSWGRVAAHPNRRYFVYKSIILNNLFGVDIMEEAVEICKLRLFLKLAAQVDPDSSHDNLGIEPLPDIDFNIRAGNTLVGYASYDEVRHVRRRASSISKTRWRASLGRLRSCRRRLTPSELGRSRVAVPYQPKTNRNCAVGSRRWTMS